jgi:aconitate hydratase
MGLSKQLNTCFADYLAGRTIDTRQRSFQTCLKRCCAGTILSPQTNDGENIMANGSLDSFGTRARLETPMGSATYYRLPTLTETGVADVARLPYSIRVLVEGALRHEDGHAVTADDVRRAAGAADAAGKEFPFMPARVVLQDFTGVPSLVDLAALRSAMSRLGGDPARINPRIPADLVIDHSIQVDGFGTAGALAQNTAREYERNRERYEFLRWGGAAFDGFRVIPPSSGIVHQVNLEYLATVARLEDGPEGPVLFPDSLVGTDSHTTMINGLGVLGWGVGGIEAEAAMLGQPLYMLIPEVVGMRLTGVLAEGVTATDLVLAVTERLRAHGVVGRFVEFFGSGLDGLTLPDHGLLPRGRGHRGLPARDGAGRGPRGYRGGLLPGPGALPHR